MVGMIWLIIDSRNNNQEIFASKERCFSYTEKRRADIEEKTNLLGTSATVEGFYSPIANTCMTHTQEIALGHYLQQILIDELTGRTEAFAFQAMGQDFAKLDIDAKKEQLTQEQYYRERLNYFQGTE